MKLIYQSFVISIVAFAPATVLASGHVHLIGAHISASVTEQPSPEMLATATANLRALVTDAHPVNLHLNVRNLVELHELAGQGQLTPSALRALAEVTEHHHSIIQSVVQGSESSFGWGLLETLSRLRIPNFDHSALEENGTAPIDFEPISTNATSQHQARYRLRQKS